MAHAELCPVCIGSGRYTALTPGQTMQEKYENSTECHGCLGMGYVVVPND